ncbi:MAG: hypothetical protein JSU07_06980 [Bacteroidetes bacterium]|nr:hypothetical protein [Bacteroidota bacterium]
MKFLLLKTENSVTFTNVKTSHMKTKTLLKTKSRIYNYALFTRTLFLAIISFYSTLKAQEASKIKEYGVGFTSLTNYSLQYRWGKTNAIQRISGNIGGSVGASVNNYSSSVFNNNVVTTTTAQSTAQPYSLSLGANYSYLILKSINSKIGYFFGPSANVSYAYSDTEMQPSAQGATSSIFKNSLTPSLGFCLGFSYKINDTFFMYAEITPSVFYSYNTSTQTSTGVPQQNGLVNTNNDQSNYLLGITNLGNSNAMITLAYRLTK